MCYTRDPEKFHGSIMPNRRKLAFTLVMLAVVSVVLGLVLAPGWYAFAPWFSFAALVAFGKAGFVDLSGYRVGVGPLVIYYNAVEDPSLLSATTAKSLRFDRYQE